MRSPTIQRVHGWEALDSRGRPTVGCRVWLAGGSTAHVIVPSGASTGGHEARELRDQDGRYEGRGTVLAVANVNQVLSRVVAGLDALDMAAVDAAMEAADADSLLGELGSNAVLAVSLAVLRAAAKASDLPLWHLLCGDETPLLPLPMINIVSGGLHAAGAVDIQDVLAVPVGATCVAEAIEWAAEVRSATAALLKERGWPSDMVADEGGLPGAPGGNEGALAVVAEGIMRAGFQPGDQVAMAVDLAANQLFDGTHYQLRCDEETLHSDAWLARLETWCERYPIVSLEDVLFEDDWEGWHVATRTLGHRLQVLGDDLFATNLARLDRGVTDGVGNAVLIKPNQAGTFTRARHVLERAQSMGYGCVVSARSGDSEDTWLADLAVGWRTGQIKVGSTTRSERTAKWNRLLEIESLAGTQARFAGRAALAPHRPCSSSLVDGGQPAVDDESCRGDVSG